MNVVAKILLCLVLAAAVLVTAGCNERIGLDMDYFCQDGTCKDCAKATPMCNDCCWTW